MLEDGDVARGAAAVDGLIPRWLIRTSAIGAAALSLGGVLAAGSTQKPDESSRSTALIRGAEGVGHPGQPRSAAPPVVRGDPVRRAPERVLVSEPPAFSFGSAVVLTAGLAALAGTSAVLGGSIERLTGSASQAVSASSVLIVFAVVGAVPSHVLGGVLDHVGFVAFLGLLIWIVVAAFLMTRPPRAV